MKFSYVDIPEDVVVKVKKQVNLAGYKFLGIIRESNHPCDHYLYLVVGQGGYKDGYCVWRFNSSVNNGDGSLGEGSYDLSLPCLFEKLGKRVAPFCYPLGKLDKFDGFALVAEGKARLYRDGICVDGEIYEDCNMAVITSDLFEEVGYFVENPSKEYEKAEQNFDAQMAVMKDAIKEHQVKLDKIQKRDIDGEEYWALYFGISNDMLGRAKWHILQKHSKSAVKYGTLSTLRQSLSALLDIDMSFSEEDVNMFMDNNCYWEWEYTDNAKEEEKNELHSDDKCYPLNIQENLLRRSPLYAKRQYPLR